MLRKLIVLIIPILVIFIEPTSVYAHDPEGMGRAATGMLILSLIGAGIVFHYARKFILRKTKGKKKTYRKAWMIASVLVSIGVMFLLFWPLWHLVMGIMLFYESGFYLRYGFLISLMFGGVFLYFAIRFVLRKTEGERIIRKVVWMIGSVLAACGVAVLVSPQYTVFNRTWTTPLVVEFCDGTLVEVQRETSKRRVIFFYPFVRFGKNEKDTFRWTKNGKHFERETWYYPMIINEYEGNIYLVEIDFGISDFGKWDIEKPSSFKFHQFVGELLREIHYTKFPKAIAYQNFKYKDRDYFAYWTEKIDPKDYNFRHSLTGLLWIYLETGENGKRIEDERRLGVRHNYPEEFFSDFMEKYMKK